MTRPLTIPGKGEDVVQNLISDVVEIHTLPVIVLAADRMMRDPRTSAQHVADLLARDPALAGRILRLVNSPFYGFQKRIGNLTQAIVILGFQTVKNLMLTVTVIESFKGTREDRFDYPGFWAHSVACAIASGEIARLARTPHAEEAYIAGLLHDIGKLLVAQHLPELAAAVVDRIEDGDDELEAERAVLGRDHSDVGGMLAGAWALPDTLVAAIRDHHHPREDREQVSPADVVHLADLLVTALGLQHGSRTTLPPLSSGLSQRLGYNESRLAEWIDAVVRRVEQASDFFEVVGAGSLWQR